jgi:hypothetical protein
MTRCGEVNRLIGWPFVEASPAICLAHRDLARSQQSPEQHGRDVPPERRKARREMCTKTSAPPLSGAMKPASYSHQHLSDSKLTEPVTSRALPRRSASRRTYPLGARRGKIQGTANGGAAQRRFENHRFEGVGAKGHSERRIRQGRRNFVRDGESAHNIWAPIHKSRRISPRRVERIVCQVIGDRAGVMTDALTGQERSTGSERGSCATIPPETVRADIMFDERNMGVEVRHAKKSRPRSSTKRGPFLRASLRTKGKHMQRFCQTTRECPVKFPRREGHLFLPVEEGPARVGRSTAGRSVRRRRVCAPGLMAENFI